MSRPWHADMSYSQTFPSAGRDNARAMMQQQTDPGPRRQLHASSDRLLPPESGFENGGQTSYIASINGQSKYVARPASIVDKHEKYELYKFGLARQFSDMSSSKWKSLGVADYCREEFLEKDHKENVSDGDSDDSSGSTNRQGPDSVQGPEAVSRVILMILLEAREELLDKFRERKSELPSGGTYNKWMECWENPLGWENSDQRKANRKAQEKKSKSKPKPRDIVEPTSKAGELTLQEKAGFAGAYLEMNVCRMVQLFEALGPSGLQKAFLHMMVLDVGEELSITGKLDYIAILPRRSDRLYCFLANPENNACPPRETAESRKAYIERIDDLQDDQGEAKLSDIRRQIRLANHAKFDDKMTYAMNATKKRSVHGIAYAWTPLLNENLPTDARLYFLKSLIDADRESEVFSTFVGQLFANQSWTKVYKGFYIDKVVLEAVSIILLLYVGFCVRRQFQPDQVPMLFMLVLNARTIIEIKIEMISIISLYGCGEGIRRYFSGWNVFIVAVETFTFCVIVYAWSGTVYGAKCEVPEQINSTTPLDCWYLKHPIYFMFVVLAKCMYFVVNLLCYQPFGEHIYCAYATLMHKSSFWFTVFIGCCLLSCILSYYMFPIAENMMSPDHKIVGANSTIFHVPTMEELYPIVTTVMKVFRLTILGDFDIWELEGVDGVVNTKDWKTKDENGTALPDGMTVAEMDDGDPNPVYHIGVMVYLVISAFLFNVLILNVYIGIISSVYDELKPHRVEIFSEFRATFTFKRLLYRHFFLTIGIQTEIDIEDADSEENLCLKMDHVDSSFHEHFIAYDVKADPDCQCSDLKRSQQERDDAEKEAAEQKT